MGIYQEGGDRASEERVPFAVTVCAPGKENTNPQHHAAPAPPSQPRAASLKPDWLSVRFHFEAHARNPRGAWTFAPAERLSRGGDTSRPRREIDGGGGAPGSISHAVQGEEGREKEGGKNQGDPKSPARPAVPPWLLGVRGKFCRSYIELAGRLGVNPAPPRSVLMGWTKHSSPRAPSEFLELSWKNPQPQPDPERWGHPAH